MAELNGSRLRPTTTGVLFPLPTTTIAGPQTSSSGTDGTGIREETVANEALLCTYAEPFPFLGDGSHRHFVPEMMDRKGKKKSEGDDRRPRESDWAMDTRAVHRDDPRPPHRYLNKRSLDHDFFLVSGLPSSVFPSEKMSGQHPPKHEVTLA